MIGSFLEWLFTDHSKTKTTVKHTTWEEEEYEKERQKKREEEAERKRKLKENYRRVILSDEQILSIIERRDIDPNDYTISQLRRILKEEGYIFYDELE